MIIFPNLCKIQLTNRFLLTASNCRQSHEPQKSYYFWCTLTVKPKFYREENPSLSPEGLNQNHFTSSRCFNQKVLLLVCTTESWESEIFKNCFWFWFLSTCKLKLLCCCRDDFVLETLNRKLYLSRIGSDRTFFSSDSCIRKLKTQRIRNDLLLLISLEEKESFFLRTLRLKIIHEHLNREQFTGKW